MSAPARNRPCPCGSGVKYKKCCGKYEPRPRRPVFAGAGATAATAGHAATASAPPAEAEELLRPSYWQRLLRRRPRSGTPDPAEDPRLLLRAVRRTPGPVPRGPASESDYLDAIQMLEGFAGLAPAEPSANVELEQGPHGRPLVVFDVPYDDALNADIKRLAGRRFDWDRRVWTVPLQASVLERLPALLERHAWLEVGAFLEDALAAELRWSARATVLEGIDGDPRLAAHTDRGAPPPELARLGEIDRDWLVLPLTAASAEALARTEGVELDRAARWCLQELRAGRPVPSARLFLGEDEEGQPRLELRRVWSRSTVHCFGALPEAEAIVPDPDWSLLGSSEIGYAMPADAALVDAVDGFLSEHPDVQVEQAAGRRLEELCEQRERARATVALSRATDGPFPGARLGGELMAFQRAGVAYALAQRRTFIADEQGLGKTVQALAALECDGAFPAAVVCPAGLKLNWEREARRWLPDRTLAVLHGRASARWEASQAGGAEIVVLNYEIVEAHRERLAARRLRAVVLDESHYCKDPRAQRTKAALALCAAARPDALKLALTGTPVLNRPKDLVSQLRLIDRLRDFGSGARLSRRFRGAGSDDRLHFHLRSCCYVRRTKREVLPQLPAKRHEIVVLGLDNEAEYRLAEEDLIAWLHTLPLDLRTLEAKVANALRAEQLARLNYLRRLAALGKLDHAVAWIRDFLASEEALVVFADHVEIQRGLLRRFPDALHVLGRDDAHSRADAVARFQRLDGRGLIVCSLRAASQGITLTRASNVAFLELDWTPARHDQAEDRCHRIGQDSAVTAWYLLAPETIDETMATLLQRKRGVIDAVTDGRVHAGEALVEAVVRDLRARPFRHLRAVA